jgi:hypothetical protein
MNRGLSEKETSLDASSSLSKSSSQESALLSVVQESSSSTGCPILGGGVPLVVRGGDAVGPKKGSSDASIDLLRVVGSLIGRNMLVASASSRSDTKDMSESSRVIFIFSLRSIDLRCFDLGLMA